MTTNSTRLTAAAIDIGSNSIKMTIGRANGEGGVDQLDWASEVVRLGQGLDRTGLLDEERIEAAIETLKRFAAQARERGATASSRSRPRPPEPRQMARRFSIACERRPASTFASSTVKLKPP